MSTDYIPKRGERIWFFKDGKRQDGTIASVGSGINPICEIEWDEDGEIGDLLFLRAEHIFPSVGPRAGQLA